MRHEDKRKLKELEKALIEDTPVQIEIIEYWAESSVGGSGLAISLQTTLKRMAREILRYRNGEYSK